MKTPLHPRTILPALALLAGMTATSPASACGSDSYVGMVCPTLARFCPTGYLELDGQTLAVADYQLLFSLVGCDWGGDCRSTFNLPDMRARSAVHVGTPPTLTGIAPGSYVGQQTQVLTVRELPAHNHDAAFTPTGGPNDVEVAIPASDQPGSSGTPGPGSVLAAAPANGPAQAAIYSQSGPDTTLAPFPVVIPPAGGEVTVMNTGDGQAFSIQNPVIAMRYCVNYDGQYPPRD